MKKWYNRVFMNDIRRAIDDFDMIQDGDKILVAVSGGKDSSFLLFALDLLRKYSYMDFDIIALHVDYGFSDHDMEPIKSFCEARDISYFAEHTDLKGVLDNEKTPCYLCARLRRGVLSRMIEAHKCTKLALGHHMDDAVETLFLNLLYNGKLGAFKPKKINHKNSVETIRPLIYVKESTIIEVTKNEKLPICDYICPHKDSTKRLEIKELVASLEGDYEDIREKAIAALKNADMENLWI